MSEPPEKVSTNDFLKSKGVDSLGTAIFGKEIIPPQERIRLSELTKDNEARRMKERDDDKARREREKADDEARRKRAQIVHTVGMLLVIALTLGSGWIVLDNNSPNEDKDWARSLLSAIGGAVAGFVFGQEAGKSKQ